MTDNTIIIGGAVQPSTTDTPTSKRDRVPTFEKIFEIDNPAAGSTVWVQDEEKEYRIISLKPKTIGGMEVPNAAVGEVVPEAEIISRSLKLEGSSVAESIASDEEAVNTIAEAIAADEGATETLAGAMSKFRKIEGDTLYL